MSERRPKIIRTGRGPVKSSRTPVASSHASVNEVQTQGTVSQESKSGGIFGSMQGIINTVWNYVPGLFRRSDQPQNEPSSSHIPTINVDAGRMDTSDESNGEENETGSVTGRTIDSHVSESQASSRMNSAPPSRDPLTRRSSNGGRVRHGSHLTSAVDIGNLVMNKAAPGRRQQASASKSTSKRSGDAMNGEGQYEGFSDKIRPANSAFGVRTGSRYLRGPSDLAAGYVHDDANPRKRRMLYGAEEVSDEEFVTKPKPKRRALSELSNDSHEMHHFSNEMPPPQTPREARQTMVEGDQGQYPSSVPAKRILQSIVNTNRRLATPVTSTDAAPPLKSLPAPAWATPARPSSSRDLDTPASSRKRRRLDLDLPPSTSLLESAATWTQRKKQRIGTITHSSSLLATPAHPTATGGLFASPATLSSHKSTEDGPAFKKAKTSEKDSFVTKPGDDKTAASPPKSSFMAPSSGSSATSASTASSSTSTAPSSSAPTSGGWKPITTPASTSSDPQKPAGMSDAEWNEVKPKPANSATLAFMKGAAAKNADTETSKPSTKTEATTVPLFKPNAPDSTKETATPAFKPFSLPSKTTAPATTPSSTNETKSGEPQKPAGMSDAEWNEVKPKPANSATLAFMKAAAKKADSEPAKAVAATNETAKADSTKANTDAPAKPAFKPFAMPPKTTAATTQPTEDKAKEEAAKPKFGFTPSAKFVAPASTASTASSSSDPQKPAGMSDAEWNEVKPKAPNAAALAFMNRAKSTVAADAEPKKAGTTSSDPQKPAGMSDAEWNEVKPKAPNAAALAFMNRAKSTAAAAAEPKKTDAASSDPQKPAGMSDAEWNEVKPKAANSATLAFMNRAKSTAAAADAEPKKTDAASSDPQKPAGMSDAEWNEVKPKPANSATLAFMKAAQPAPVASESSSTKPSSTSTEDQSIPKLNPSKLAFGKVTAPTAKVPASTIANDGDKSKSETDDNEPAPKKSGFAFSGSSPSTLTKFGSFGKKPSESSTEDAKSSEASTDATPAKKASFASFKPLAPAASSDSSSLVAAAAKSSMLHFGAKDSIPKPTPFGKVASEKPADTKPALSFGASKPSTTLETATEKKAPSTAITQPKDKEVEKPTTTFPKMTPFAPSTAKDTAAAPVGTSFGSTATGPSFAKFGAGSTSSPTSTAKPAFGSLKSSTSTLTSTSTSDSTSAKPAFGAKPMFGGASQSETATLGAKGAAFNFSSPSTAIVANPLAAFKAAATTNPSQTPATTWGTSTAGTSSFGSGGGGATALFPSSTTDVKSLFGSTTATTTAPTSGFTPSTSSLFGTTPAGSSTFSSSTPSSGFSSTPASTGGSKFGTGTSFASTTGTAFGAASSGTSTGTSFGATGTSFGATGTSFGASSGQTNGFGTGTGTSFGASGGTGTSFGASGGTAFGASGGSGGGGGIIPSGVSGFSSSGFKSTTGGTSFGASSGTPFGASSGTSFGATSTSTSFGSTGSLFGASSTASTSGPLFGSASSTAFPTSDSSASNSPRVRTRAIRRPR